MNDEDLRDLFAGLALMGMSKDIEDERRAAKWCYEMADAMIEARYAEEPEEPEEPEVGIAAVKRKRTTKEK